MNTLKKIMIIFAAAVLAMLLAGLSSGLAETSPSSGSLGFTIAQQMSPTYLAYTQCTQMGDSLVTISWVRTEVLDSDQENAIVAHEHMHQEQMQRFSNCGSAYKWYRDNRIEAEAEAYCRSARVFQRDNPMTVTLDGAIYFYANWLKNYDPEVNHADAILAIKEFCNDG